MLFADGSSYEGEFLNDKREGYGILKNSSDNIIYEGEWKNDKFDGNGTCYNADPQNENSFDYNNFDTMGKHWVKYDGEFSGGLK